MTDETVVESSGNTMATDGGTTELQTQTTTETQTQEEVTTEQPAQTPEETPEQKTERERNQRFSEVTRRQKESERRAQEAERTASLALEALNRVAQQKPVETKPEEQQPQRPNRGEYQDADEFAQATLDYAEKLASWTAKQQVSATLSEREKADATRRAQEQEAQQVQSYQSARDKALAELPDFQEIAENPSLQVSPVMRSAMLASADVAPKILYFLGQNPKEAARIAQLPPAMQLMEIGMIRGRLDAAPATPSKPLPPPIKPTGANRSTSKSVEEMSMDEYAAHRNAQIKASRMGAH